MARVLVLGGAGFIAFHLAQRLATAGYDQITLVDDLSRGKLDPELEALLASNSEISLIRGDLTKPETFEEIHGSYDHVYLMAGIVGVRNVLADPLNVLRTNTMIVLNTLDWLKSTRCSRLLFASTSEVYSDAVDQGVAGVPTNEDVPVGVKNPQEARSTYALSKIWGESAVAQYAYSCDFEAVIVRYHNVYGPRMGFEHVIPEFMERMLNGIDPFPVYGPEQTRAFCYVTDAVEASLALMDCPIDACELVHVGNDNEIRVNELLKEVLSLTEFQPSIRELPAPAASVSRRCPDINKLHQLTGFLPVVSIQKGLALTWDWYRQNRRTDGESIFVPSSAIE